MKRREFISLLGSAAAGWPLAARAQQTGMPVIGFLSLQQFPPTSVTAFREGLAEVDYVEGKNVAIEFRTANLQNSLLPRLAADLVDRKVAVIVAAGASAATMAKAATSTIPIVFTVPDDPRKDGLVASLNRPEGNLTGINFRGIELAGKRLSLLSELVSKTATVAYLSGSTSNPTFEAQKSDILAAAHVLGRDIFIAPVEEGNFDAAFATIAQRRAGALIVGNVLSFITPSNRQKILQLAGRHKIPAIYPDAIYAVQGGLMSYAADILAIWRQLGSHYVGQILKGAKPADLPVQQPTKFELVINLKTAKAMEFTIPPVLFATATQVID